MEISHHRWQQDLGADPSSSGSSSLRLVLLAASLIALTLQLPLSHAESGTETNSPSQTFAVALPELEGPVTMGIFSAKGDLVRLLYRDAAVDSIPAGLNGLIMTWDEKDASGKQVPPGTYRARGLVHGQVSVSKLLFHDRFWLSPASESGATNASSGNGSCSNTIMISSARDVLLPTRAMIAIKATPLDKTVQISANTLPLLELPITPSTSPVLATLSKGVDAGTGVITVATGGETSSCTISGLDRIVPLEAGTLEIPPGTFHPAPVGEESRR